MPSCGASGQLVGSEAGRRYYILSDKQKRDKERRTKEQQAVRESDLLGLGPDPGFKEPEDC